MDQRTVSDLSYQLSKEALEAKLPAISEVEDAKCECCGMSEECTPEYIQRVKEKFSDKMICGLCSEAVKEECEKNGGKREEALNSHMSFCSRFNKFGRTQPVLLQAEAMRDLLRKCTVDGKVRAKSNSPKDRVGGKKGGGIMRSSSCIPAITKEMTAGTTVN
ncbi:hypothetical protein ACHQM5_028705 [Ranunculus cassubicifolius]